jgi:hypothetical protein
MREHLAQFLSESSPNLQERLLVDPMAHLELVALAASARADTSVVLSAAVRSARFAGCTWAQIGDVLGITRQAAQQRYGEDDEPAPPPDSATAMTLSPVTAFDEMPALERAGMYGWKVVGYGFMHHRLERFDHQWEHARTILGVRPPGDGWERVRCAWDWFFWSYWTRPVDRPALAGNPTAAELIRGDLWR